MLDKIVHTGLSLLESKSFKSEIVQKNPLV